MAGEYVFTIEGLSKSHGTKKVFENIWLSFYHKAKIGIVGENGSGKTTLLRVMAQEDTDFRGKAEPRKGVRIGVLHQEPQLDKTKTVREEVESAFADVQAKLAEYDALSEKMAEPLSDDEMTKVMDKMGKLQEDIEAVDGWNLKRHVDVAMDALVLPADDLKIDKLSGGELRRVALCKLLLQKPDILLLDEPTNHLDGETVAWLEKQLQEYPGNVIVVTHDRYFLDNITQWILELDKGKGIPFEGNYSSWLRQKAKALAAADKKGDKSLKRMQKELDWMALSLQGRHDQNTARLREIDAILNRQKDQDAQSADIQFVPGPALGNKVIDVAGLSKAYGDMVLLKEVSFSIPKGAVVGLVGPNGVGKTTLFRAIVGEEKPDAGTVEVGETVKMSYVDQKRETLQGDKTVFEEIGGGNDHIELGGKTVPTRLYLGRFNFKGTDQQKKVGSLSGGERNRLHLAKQLLKGANVVLLDEPTNDLDVDTLRTLEDAIMDFGGTVLVISHDRFFLNRVCTHLLVFEGEGKVRWFSGNFEDYQKVRQEELGGREENRRSKYKKLTLR